MSATTDPKVAARVCTECSGPLPADVELFEPICDACLDAEHDRVMAEAKEFRQPAPPPIPVRERYYMIECEHCGWVGSSEQCGGEDDDIVCPVCCSSICGDGPSEADTAKHGEAVMQRILLAEAERDTLAIALEIMLDSGHGGAMAEVRRWFAVGRKGGLPWPGGAVFCAWAAERGIRNVRGFAARPSSPTTGGAA